MGDQVLEGTWEEIALQGEKLAGRRVRLTVFAEEAASPGAEAESLDAKGWPAGFFEETFGSLADDPFERLPQREYETRDSPE